MSSKTVGKIRRRLCCGYYNAVVGLKTLSVRSSGGRARIGARPSFPLIICTPVGPQDERAVRELLESFRCYLEAGSYRVVLIDDSGRADIWGIARGYPEVDYLRNWTPRGIHGLDDSLRRGYRWCLENYTFDGILKIDTDALLINPGLVEAMRSRLKSDSRIGLLGAHKIDCTGAARNFSSIASQFERSFADWSDVIQLALGRGYLLGEHAQGGAYILSYPCVHAMQAAGYLAAKRSAHYVSEDGIFSLYVKALGFEIADFAYDGPLGIAYRGLPMPKEDLVAQGKKVIHSVKNRPEDDPVRRYFADRRGALVRELTR